MLNLWVPLVHLRKSLIRLCWGRWCMGTHCNQTPHLRLFWPTKVTSPSKPQKKDNSNPILPLFILIYLKIPDLHALILSTAFP